jgi:hypothetical protein
MNAINLKTFLSNPKRIGAIVNILLLLKCDIVVEKKNMLKIYAKRRQKYSTFGLILFCICEKCLHTERRSIEEVLKKYC